MTLQLYANGEPVNGKTVTVGFDADGNLLEGTVKVDDNTWKLDLYDCSEKHRLHGIHANCVHSERSRRHRRVQLCIQRGFSPTSTNSYTPEVVSKTVVKLWDDLDDMDQERPQNVLVQLYADGEPVEGGESGSPTQITVGPTLGMTFPQMPTAKK